MEFPCKRSCEESPFGREGGEKRTEGEEEYEDAHRHLVPLTPTVLSDAPSLGISLAPLLPTPSPPRAPQSNPQTLSGLLLTKG